MGSREVQVYRAGLNSEPRLGEANLAVQFSTHLYLCGIKLGE